MHTPFGIISPLLLFAFLCPGASLAQPASTQPLPYPYIELNMGTGLSPRTMFMPSSNTLWMDFVKPGYCAGINGDLPLFHSHFGLRATLGYYFNSFNMQKYTGELQSAMANSTVTSVSYGSFAQYSFMAGAFASYTKHKLTFEAFALAGAEYLYLPNTAINVVITSPGQAQYTRTVIYNTYLAFAYGGGIEAAYSLYKNLSVSLAADCLLAGVSYHSTRYDEYIQNIGYTYYSSGLAQVFMPGIKAALRYSFGK